MKENDWIVANITNPEFDNGDFRTIGLNLDNTLLLSREDYLKSTFIKENDAFKDDKGEFSEQKFNDFYNQKAKDFENFLTIDNTFVYDLFDYNRYSDPNARIKDTGFVTFRESNPMLTTIGVSGINELQESPLSAREIAQQTKIRDFESGNFLDITPNDMALTSSPKNFFKLLFSLPLVLATYDAEGEHIDPISGKVVSHKKGDYILNDDGQLFYETLSGRSIAGKQVLSTLDILTVDGTKINHYDIFDSDGLEKDPSKTILKAAATLAPLFLSAPVAGVYSAAMIARELAKALPMIDGLIGIVDSTDTLFTKFANNAAGWATLLSPSKSDKGQSGFFTLENLATLITDVALLWELLKLIALGIAKLSGAKLLEQSAIKSAEKEWQRGSSKLAESLRVLGLSEEEILKQVGDAATWETSLLGALLKANSLTNVAKNIEKANKVGKDVALGYMALVSNTDVYQELLDRGLTKGEAVAVSLGSAAGMYAVDRVLNIGDTFFKNLTPETKLSIRATFKNKAKEWALEFEKTSRNENLTKLEKFKSLVSRGKNFGKSTVSEFAENLKYHTLGGLEKGIAEGLEEVSEEVSADIVKLLYEILGYLGVSTSTTDIGAFDNIFKDPGNIKSLLGRYGANFAGGFVGGEIFYGKELFNGRTFKRDTTLDELIYLIRNNKVDTVLNELERLRKKGKLGNTNLSYKFDESTGVFLTTQNKEDSQNEFIYNRLKEEILSIAGIIKEYDLNKSDDDLYNTLMFNNPRFNLLKSYLTEDGIKEVSYQTGYYLQYLQIASDVISARRSIDALNTRPDSEKRTELFLQELAAALALLLQKLKDLLDFYSGETALEYMRKTMFLMDGRINSPFFSATFEIWLKNNKNLNILDLSPDDVAKYREEYTSWKNSAEGKLASQQAWEAFKNMQDAIAPELIKAQTELEKYRQWTEKTQDLFKRNPFEYESVNADDSFEGKIDWNDLLEGESLDEYNIRDILLDTETSEEFASRKKARENIILDLNVAKANEINLQRSKEAIDKVDKLLDEAGDYIDSTTRRNILLHLNLSKKEIINSYFESLLQLLNLKSADLELTVRDILQTVDSDLSNIKDAFEDILNIVRGNIMEPWGPLNAKRYNYFNKDRNLQKLKNLSADLDLSNLELLTLALLNYGIKEADIDDVLPYVLHVLKNGTSLEETVNYTLEEIQQINAVLGPALANLDRIFQDVKNNITNNEGFKFLDKVDKKSHKINPIIQIISKLNLSTATSTLEEVLEKMYERLSLNKRDEFVLNPLERMILEDAELLIKMANSLIYATWYSKDFKNPLVHNLLSNEVAKELGVKLELPILNDNTAILYNIQLQNYLYEIGLPDGDSFTPGSWRYWDNKNQMNKARKNINTNKAINKSHYLFIISNKDLFKGTIKSGDSEVVFDLLEGMTELAEDGQGVSLHSLENVIYSNWIKLQNITGCSFTDLLNALNLKPYILGRKNTIQKSAKLNENLLYTDLTALDIVQYIFTICSESSTDFFTFIKDSKNDESNRTLLPGQKALVRLGRASSKHPEWYKQAIEWLSQFKDENDKLTIASNTLLVLGNGGSGKTYAGAHYISKGLKDSEVWISAPKSLQLKNLGELAKGTPFLRDTLLQEILSKEDYSSYTTIIEFFKSHKNDTPEVFSREVATFFAGLKNSNFEYSKTRSGQYTVKFKGTFTKNAPKLLLIDEITFYPTLAILILDSFMKTGKGILIGLGDDVQNGFDLTYMENIDRSVLFAGRSHKLTDVIRTSNIQVDAFELLFSSCIDYLNSIDSTDPSRSEKIKSAEEQYKLLTLRYYESASTINGIKVVDELTEETVKKLPVTDKIGFVGSKDSVTYNILKKYCENIELFNTEEEVQGSEFAAIVVDKDTWLYSIVEGAELTYANLLEVEKSLYTLGTRARGTAIFVGKSFKNLQIKNIRDLFTSIADNFLKVTLPKFIELEDKFLATIDLTPLLISEKARPPKYRKGSYVLYNELTYEVIDVKLRGNDIRYTLLNIDNNSTIETSDEDGLQLTEIKEVVAQIVDVDKADTFNDKTLKSTEALNKKDIEVKEEVEERLVLEVIDSSAELLQGTILGYCENTLLGCVSLKNSETNKEEWHLNNFIGEVPEDIAAIAKVLELSKIWKKGNIVTEGEDKNFLVQQLVELKMYLANKDSVPFDTVQSFLQTLGINRDTKISYKVVVRKKRDIDHFVDYSDLSTLLMEIGEEELAYFLVADIKSTINTELVPIRITMGMLGDPERLSGKEDYLTDLVKQKLSLWEQQLKSTTDEDTVISLQQNIAKANLYISSISSGFQKNKMAAFAKAWQDSENDEVEFEIPITSIRYSGQTELRNVIRNSKDVPRVRLAPLPYTITYDGENALELAPFITKNKHLVISDVYTFKPGDKFDGNEDIAGKSVIFVSKFLWYLADDLVNKWLEETRLNLPHTVRMIRLDHAGVSLNLLGLVKYRQLLRSEYKTGKYKHFPFELEPTGYRMLTSLWNFRANLQLFINAVNQSLENGVLLNFTNDSLDLALKQLGTLWNEFAKDKTNPTEVEFEEYMKANDSENKFAAIFNFNKSINYIKSFRLGSYENKLYLVRSLGLTTSDEEKVPYTKKQLEKGVFGLYTSYSTALKFQTLLLNLFDSVISPYCKVTDGAGLNFDPSSRIEINKEGKLAGKIRIAINHGEIIIDEKTKDGENKSIIFPEGKTIKYLPIIISDLAKYAIAHQEKLRALENGEDIDWDDVQYYKISGEEIGSDALKAFNDLVQDSNTVDLLNLILHGTVQRFTDLPKGVAKPLLMTDAYFKNGIFIDSMVSESALPASSNVYLNFGLFFKSAMHPALFTVQVAVDMPRFWIDYFEEPEKPQLNNPIVRAENPINNDLIEIQLKNSGLSGIENTLKNSKNANVIKKLGLTINLIKDNNEIVEVIKEDGKTGIYKWEISGATLYLTPTLPETIIELPKEAPINNENTSPVELSQELLDKLDTILEEAALEDSTLIGMTSADKALVCILAKILSDEDSDVNDILGYSEINAFIKQHRDAMDTTLGKDGNLVTRLVSLMENLDTIKNNILKNELENLYNEMNSLYKIENNC